MINISSANSKNWEQTTIGESLKLKSGDFLSAANMDTNGKYPVYGGNGITGYHSSYLFENRKIVIGRVGAYCGAVHHTLPYSWITDNALYVAKKDSRLLDEYLVYILRSANLNQYASQSGQPLISEGRLENVKIPLPPLPEQKRIAAILEKCDRLRRTRRYSLQLSETFLQSVFLEMFGDPVTNPMGWNELTIEDISTKITDGEHTTPQRTDHGIKLLSARNIQNGYIDFTTGLDYISESEYQRIKKRCNPELGDILMSCSGSIGRVTTVDIVEPFSMVRSVALIKPNHSKIITKYFEHYLRTNHSQYLINQNAHQSSQANIFTGQIKELPVPLPPLPLQEKFAQIVQKHDRFRTQQREAQRQAEHLFQTLLHRAFRGELTSSDCNDVDISVLSAENHPQQPKPKSTDKGENLPIPATQPQTNALQLTLPGLE
ncbi:MAG: restriction endonuclease subunit S [Dolichospermum sp. DET73]|nr:restriction endonuclease subunit S [Dolichospermum sp. DET73]